MQKEVIYIDTEDDITAIIGKVRASKSKIVAIVPPKRIGAIQSAVNLKLVHRASEQAEKRLVIISSNSALTALASSAGIPVAKNLQSKPELAEVPALDVDDGDDVIDGSQLQSAPTPIKAPNISPKDSGDSALASVEREEAMASKKTALGATALSADKKIKVPNFDKFRKRLFIILAGVVLVAGFLVWAIKLAPTASIVITARTMGASLNTQVKIGDDLTTSLRDGTVKSVTKSIKKDVSIPFNATGSKNVGEKATGTIVMKTCVTAFPPTTPASVPAGTTITASGNNYVTGSAATFSQVGYGVGCMRYESGNITITAVEGGQNYNTSNSTQFTVGDGVSATGGASGGTDKVVTVVQQSDIDTALGNVVSSSDSDNAKKSFKTQFDGGFVTLDSTFKADSSSVKPNPELGSEVASGKATLVGSIVFTEVAVPKQELNNFLNDYFAKQIDGKANQKVYDSGVGTASFTNINNIDKAYTANITANGKIGPKIDEDSLKQYARGKRLGELQTYIQNINGVDDVNIKYSPFWVNKSPNNIDKIHIEFKVNG